MTLSLAGAGGAPPIPGLSSDGASGIAVAGNVEGASQTIFGASTIYGLQTLTGSEVVDGTSSLGADAVPETGLFHAYTHAVGHFSVSGDAQYDRFIKFVETTDATPTVLRFPWDDHTVVLDPPVAQIVQIELVALSLTDINTAAGWSIRSLLRNVNSGATVVGTPAVSTWSDTGAATWTAALLGNGGGVELTVTGVLAKTIHWVCTIHRTAVV